MNTVRTSVAVLFGALTMVAAPVAAAADKPDDEHRYFATDGRGLTRAVPDRVDEYGLPRAMPSHYERAGIELQRQTGAPRTMPADYAAAGAALDAPHVPVAVAHSGPGFDWADAGLGAAAAFLMLALIGSSLLVVRRRRETRMGASVVQH
jgi:hypothetical protein